MAEHFSAYMKWIKKKSLSSFVFSTILCEQHAIGNYTFEKRHLVMQYYLLVYFLRSSHFCFHQEMPVSFPFEIAYSLMAQWIKICLQCRRHELESWEMWVRSLDWKISWRKKWQSTPVLLPEKSDGQRSLLGYSPEAHKELDMVKQLSTVGIDKIYFTFPWKHMKTTKIRMLQKLWIVFCWVTYLSEIIFSFIVKVWWFESPKRSILQDRAMAVLVNKIV